MDQIKIGNFIATCRKEKQLTQLQLAEQLGITDRAVSKWERGKSMPDASIMLDLCQLLDISVNELLSGEKLTQDHYHENYKELAEQQLIQLRNQEEVTNKAFLCLEIVIGVIGTSSFLIMMFIAEFAVYDIIWRSILIGLGLIIFLVSVFFAVKIERDAGYYECGKCHYRYVPTLKDVFLASHLCRTRYLKCPKCGQKSWNKKVLRKD